MTSELEPTANDIIISKQAYEQMFIGCGAGDQKRNNSKDSESDVFGADHRIECSFVERARYLYITHAESVHLWMNCREPYASNQKAAITLANPFDQIKRENGDHFVGGKSVHFAWQLFK